MASRRENMRSSSAWNQLWEAGSVLTVSLSAFSSPMRARMRKRLQVYSKRSGVVQSGWKTCSFTRWP